MGKRNGRRAGNGYLDPRDGSAAGESPASHLDRRLHFGCRKGPVDIEPRPAARPSHRCDPTGSGCATQPAVIPITLARGGMAAAILHFVPAGPVRRSAAAGRVVVFRVEIRCLPWAEAGPEAASAWAALRASNPALRSPYFAWEFVDTVASVQGRVEVALLTEAARPVGYFPFQRVSARRARPVGSPMNDYQGLIAGSGLVFDPLRLLQSCDLDRFEFDHLVVEQASWAPYHRARARSPYLDLESGFETWTQDRLRAGHSRFQRLKKLRRALAQTQGPLRFELDVRDERVLDQLLALKSDQYCRTLGPERDLFANPSMAAIVREILRLRSPALCGVLSALWAGEGLAAAHFGMRSGPVLHWWFPAFAPALSKYSPGALLLLDVTEAAPGAGIALIDFGKGDEPYKLRFATGAFEVAEGWVDVNEEEIVRGAAAKS